MIKFIDIETGNVFEGAKPYIHWYDDGQSVNLIYAKELYLVSDNESLTITIPNTGVFDLLDTAKVNAASQAIIAKESSAYTYDIYDNMYMKIDREEDDKITVCGTFDEETDTISVVSVGTQYNDSAYYVHKIYFIAKSVEAGEFREDFTITSETESVECTIAADFYNEDERLGIALKNFGMDAPSLVQRAIYEGNVHEEYQDNILINRKWKELLINYQDCLMNKGSYKSLINCLEWFGYGDAIKLTEYWRDAWNTGTLYEQDIKDTIYNITKELLRSNAKTTYIGILLALQKVSDEYDEYEPIPEVINRGNLLFSISDLCLKMTLLGNFFSTYFMPIHLDLIHCSIENLVFSTTLKILSEGENKVVAYNDSNEALKVEVDSAFKLMDVHTHVYVGPEFQLNGAANHATVAHRIVDENTKMFGFELTYKDYMFQNEWQAAQYGEQLYGGPGCVVQFKCTIPNVENTSHFLITSIMIKIVLENESPQIEYIQTNIPVGENPIAFNYLFKKYGNYIVDIQMFSNIGKEYSKRVRFTIEENVFNGIEAKKVVRRPAKELYECADFKQENGLSIYGSYSFSNDIPENAIYSQYIHAGENSQCIGLNSIITIDLSNIENSITVEFMDNSTIEFDDFSDLEGVLVQLKEQIPWYIWTIRYAYDSISSHHDDPLSPILIGIRKIFTNSLNENAYAAISYQQLIDKTIEYSVGQKKYEKDTYELEIKYVYFLEGITAIWTLTENGTDITQTITTNNTVPVSYLDYKFELKTTVENEHVGNIAFNWQDIAPTYEYYDKYGIEKYKIKNICYEYDENALTNCMFNEERFIPVFHKLSDIKDDVIHTNESFILIPKLKYMKSIEKANADMPLWTFHNATTGKNYYSENYQNQLVNITKPILSNFSPVQITPGYYDVILNMRIWENYKEDEYQQQKVESIVKVEP